MKFGTAVVLAGGKSRRMTYDKQELLIGGDRLMEVTIRSLSALFDEVLIVSNRPELYQDLSCRVIADIYPGHGPLSGIHTALIHARSDLIYVRACDMPNLNLEFIQYMISLYRPDYDGVITKKGDYIEPMNALYHRCLIPGIEEMLEEGRYRVYDLVKPRKFYYIEEETAKRYSGSADMYFNINTMEDLKQYESMTQDQLRDDSVPK